MKNSKIILAFILAFSILISQIGVVYAAPANDFTLLTGKVTEIKVETDINTAVTTVLVTILDKNSVSQKYRISVEAAEKLGLLTTDDNGTPLIKADVLGSTIRINPKTVILDEQENRHLIGDALATFFAEITDYETVMKAHEEGAGFGVIAQALWLTQKLQGNSDEFLAILDAKETGKFDAFAIVNEDGTTTIPTNWEQFKNAVLAGDKKGNLGVVISTKNKDKGNNYSNSGNNPSTNGNGNNDNGNNGNDNGNHGNGNNGNDNTK